MNHKEFTPYKERDAYNSAGEKQYVSIEEFSKLIRVIGNLNDEDDNNSYIIPRGLYIEPKSKKIKAVSQQLLSDFQSQCISGKVPCYVYNTYVSMANTKEIKKQINSTANNSLNGYAIGKVKAVQGMKQITNPDEIENNTVREDMKKQSYSKVNDYI